MTLTGPEDLEDALVDALVRNAFQVMGVLTRIGAEHDLSLTQIRVLGLLRDRRPRMTELAAFLGLDKSTMSGLVDRAERRGLLARDKNAYDGRVIDVFMTPAGLELTQRLYNEVRRALAPTTAHLDPQQRNQLLRLLEPIGISPSHLGHPADEPRIAVRVSRPTENEADRSQLLVGEAHFGDDDPTR